MHGRDVSKSTTRRGCRNLDHVPKCRISSLRRRRSPLIRRVSRCLLRAMERQCSSSGSRGTLRIPFWRVSFYSTVLLSHLLRGIVSDGYIKPAKPWVKRGGRRVSSHLRNAKGLTRILPRLSDRLVTVNSRFLTRSPPKSHIQKKSSLHLSISRSFST
jgi:hypothetical protein